MQPKPSKVLVRSSPFDSEPSTIMTFSEIKWSSEEAKKRPGLDCRVVI